MSRYAENTSVSSETSRAEIVTKGSTEKEKERWRELRDRDRTAKAQRKAIRQALTSQQSVFQRMLFQVLREETRRRRSGAVEALGLGERTPDDRPR